MKKIEDQPHAKRRCNPGANLKRGWLKNGNPPGDLSKTTKCGAFARTTGRLCQGPAMRNGRCRMHGGKSTGPKTKEGLNCSRRGNWKHGLYSKQAEIKMMATRDFLSNFKQFLNNIREV